MRATKQMDIFGQPPRRKKLLSLLGLLLGGAALYLSLKGIDAASLKKSLAGMEKDWMAPIVAVNFAVIALKALRWQMTLRPVKAVAFPLVFKTLTIGFAANNVLPGRVGEIFRIHLLGKEACLSRATTATTLLSDRIIEALGFLFFAALLIFATTLPPWMKKGLLFIVGMTAVLCPVLVLASRKKFTHVFFERLKNGLAVFHHPRIFSLCLFLSILSWFVQAFLLWMVQASFGIALPWWVALLVLIAVNLAVMLPASPGHVGTFEYAAILAYSMLGIDKNMALLLGGTYHLVQMIPVTLAGIFFVTADRLQKNPQPSGDPGRPY